MTASASLRVRAPAVGPRKHDDNGRGERAAPVPSRARLRELADRLEAGDLVMILAPHLDSLKLLQAEPLPVTSARCHLLAAVCRSDARFEAGAALGALHGDDSEAGDWPELVRLVADYATAPGNPCAAGDLVDRLLLVGAFMEASSDLYLSLADAETRLARRLEAELLAALQQSEGPCTP